MPRRRPVALEPLFALSPSQARPALLELAAHHAERRRPADLLEQFARDRFVEPSPLDQRLAHRLDGLALDAAPDFEALLLAPVAPLGTCSVVAPTSQDRTLSTVRTTEVVSDPTNVLALESARRLREQPETLVRLCSLHQVLRAQPLPPEPGYTRHFRLFALTSAGAARPDDAFEVEAVARHVGVLDRIFEACAAALDCRLEPRRALVLAAPGHETLGTRIATTLRDTLGPRVPVLESTLESRYYDGLRVLFGAETPQGRFVPLSDTGRFDWVAQLTANHRLRFVASGLGLQLLPLLFR